jgi:hypothetical protein
VLGIVGPKPDLVRERGDRLAEGEQLRVDLLGRAVPVVRASDGLRAVSKSRTVSSRTAWALALASFSCRTATRIRQHSDLSSTYFYLQARMGVE